MITFIHGDDLVSSRSYYKSLQGKQVVVLEEEKITLALIQEALQSNGLFGDEQTICIENFFSKKKPSKEFNDIVTCIAEYGKTTTILLWESKEISKKIPTVFPHATVKLFTFPKSLFVFLDNVTPQNRKQLLTLYHQTLQHTDAEMVLVMLIRHIRILLALHDAQTIDPIDEVKRLAPWQIKKMLIQSRTFTKEQLRKLHNALFDLEMRNKTGKSALPLLESIDFFIASI